MKNTILLYSPPPVLEKPSTRAPLALLAIAGPLTVAGYRVIILPRDPAAHSAVFQALAGDILCYGLSVMTGPQINIALASTRAFKECCSAPVVWGGWHPTIFPEQVARQAEIDFAVAGRGEDAFLALAKCLSGKMSYRGIEGLVFAADGRLINNGIARGKDINGYPPLDYGLLEMDNYIFADDIAARTINYVSSRGCPKNCPSCAQSLVSGGTWRAYTPARLVNEAIRLRDNFGIGGILFDDANFFVDGDRARDFAAGLINRQAALHWGMPTARLEDAVGFSDLFWDLLRNSGLQSVFVGLEPRCGAISRSQTDVYGEFRPAVDGLAGTLNRHGIALKLSILVGFPPSGVYKWTFEDELTAATQLIDSAITAGASVSPSISLYLPFPHAPLYDLALKSGLRPPTTLDGWGSWDPGSQDMPWVPTGAKEKIGNLNNVYSRTS